MKMLTSLTAVLPDYVASHPKAINLHSHHRDNIRSYIILRMILMEQAIYMGILFISVRTGANVRLLRTRY